MHGVAEAGSVRASHWLRREHAAYMVTPLLALDAWLGQNIKKRTRNVSSWPDWRVSLRGLGFIGLKYDEARNRIHARNSRSSPLLVYIDLLALLCILHASTMCCVVTVFTLSNIESNKSKSCPALPLNTLCCLKVCL